MDKFISVVIPTFNNEDTIEECLKSIFSNENAPKFEVIVVDGGSTDRTVEIVKQFPVRTPKLRESGRIYHAESVNYGVSQALGEIIAFTDADVRVEKNWLSVLSKHFDDPHIAGVGGPNITPNDEPFWPKCFGILMESFLGGAGARNTAIYKNIREVDHNPPVNSALRKIDFMEVGGQGETVGPADDTVLDAKIRRRGRKLIYDPTMIVWHHRRKTLKSFLWQLFLYGRGRASVFLKYPESLPLTYFCVAAFAAGTILTIPLYIFFGLLRPIIIFGWSAYLLFILSASLFISIQKRRYILVPILLVLAILEHFTLGIGFLTGLINPYNGPDNGR
ncbi:MAG: glycosyltransferase [Dehalococcoidia bacterium]|jgi:GT2 family glycosyltransferase